MIRSYTVEYDDEMPELKAYRNESKTLSVWSIEKCLERLKAVAPEEATKYFGQLTSWIDTFSDEMERSWAEDCFRQMEKAYDLIISTPQTPEPSAVNLFG